MATQAPQPLGSVQHPGKDGGRQSEQTPPGALASGRTLRVSLTQFLHLRSEAAVLNLPTSRTYLGPVKQEEESITSFGFPPVAAIT